MDPPWQDHPQRKTLPATPSSGDGVEDSNNNNNLKILGKL